MAFRGFGAALAISACIAGSTPASAYLFWGHPNFAGEPVNGDETGMGMPLPKATAKELQAHMLWNMRAGLNVAALQCQFAPILMAISNYNDLLSKNVVEFSAAQATLNGYFKRMNPKTWQTAFDQYTTRTYNGFSTMHAQFGFCETASAIGRDARKLPRGQFTQLALSRMREFRNSLVPVGDSAFIPRPFYIPIPTPSLDKDCWTKNNELKAQCAVVSPYRSASVSGSAG